jgi:Domain of unknown function (DUF4266)
MNTQFTSIYGLTVPVRFGATLKRLGTAAGLGLFLALGTTGCQNVEPWQRGTLADYTMRADRDPMGDAQRDHIFFSREEASGGKGVGGGGCGCN